MGTTDVPTTERGKGVVLTWTGDQVLHNVALYAGRRLEAAGLLLVGEVKRDLSTGQDFRWSVPRKPGSKPRKVGLDPAPKGQPPHLLDGLLRNSVSHEVRVFAKKRAVLRVGAFVKYAKRHELGFHPFLRPALFRNAARVHRIVADGKFGGGRGR